MPLKKEHKKTSYEAFYQPYNSLFVVVCVRLTGIEPALREKLDPKSSASASSATGAFAVAKVSIKNERSLCSPAIKETCIFVVTLSQILKMC